MPLVTPVDDPLDPRLAPYRVIRERDLVGREGHFIAEGEVVLKLLLGPAARHEPISLLVAESRLARLETLIAGLPETVPVYRATQKVIDAVAGFNMHRGMLALGRRAPDLPPASLLEGLGERAIVVVLVGIANHDNVGGIFRNAAAFGAAAVLLDRATCDPLYRKAIRVSVGATLTVPFARIEPGTDIATLLDEAGFAAIALSPAGAEPLAAYARPPRVAAIFGTEGPGLPQSLLARIRTVAIPMAPGFDSLNVATTSGIVLHHLVTRG